MNSPGKKPRADSRLKNLPIDLQAKIYARCRGESYDKVALWLRRTHKIRTNTGSLSKFFAWFPLQSRLEQLPQFAELLKAQLAQIGDINATAEQLSELSLAAFETQAVQDRDAELFVELRRLRLKSQEQAIASRRVAVLEAQAKLAEDAEKAARDPNLTPEQREARLFEIFGLRKKETQKPAA